MLFFCCLINIISLISEMHGSVILTHIQYFLNCLCLRRNWLRLLGYSSRQPLWHNICVYAYLLQKMWKSHESAFQWYILFLFGVHIDAMVRFRGVGKVCIISTPNRNRKLCHWNALSWDQACCPSIHMCARTLTIYHSAWVPHWDRQTSENDKLSWGSSTGLIVQIDDYSFRGAETTNRGLKPT